MTTNKAVEAFILKRAGSVKSYPFGPQAAVFKVEGKMFALIAWQLKPVDLTLKALPSESQHLRSTFDAVRPGYHMNKDHWNTISLDGSMPGGLIKKLINDSYDLVFQKLTKASREKVLHKI